MVVRTLVPMVPVVYVQKEHYQRYTCTTFSQKRLEIQVHVYHATPPVGMVVVSQKRIEIQALWAAARPSGIGRTRVACRPGSSQTQTPQH